MILVLDNLSNCLVSNSGDFNGIRTLDLCDPNVVLLLGYEDFLSQLFNLQKGFPKLNLMAISNRERKMEE